MAEEGEAEGEEVWEEEEVVSSSSSGEDEAFRLREGFFGEGGLVRRVAWVVLGGMVVDESRVLGEDRVLVSTLLLSLASSLSGGGFGFRLTQLLNGAFLGKATLVFFGCMVEEGDLPKVQLRCCC